MINRDPPLWSQGFSSQKQERQNFNLPVTGSLPDWLELDLFRNGPALFEVESDSFNHWFDGFAKLHKFSFSGGTVGYNSRFIDSKAYRGAASSKKLSSQEFATASKKSIFQKFASIAAPDLTDNTNVNILFHDGRYLALTETSYMNEFDPLDLSTIGPFQFSDSLPGHLTTAHPQLDPLTGEVFNLMVEVSSNSQYHFYSIAPGSRTRDLLASVPVSNPGYVHSFSLTERYLILMECPLLLNPLELAFGLKPYIDTYHWHKDLPTRFLIIDKDQRALVSILETDPYFCFHHINAYEESGKIILDAAVYDDARIVDKLRLKNLRSPSASVQGAFLQRFILNLESRRVEVEIPADCNLELPRINYMGNNSMYYDFVYGCSVSQGSSFLDQLIKVDLKNSDLCFWAEEGTYPGEPVFAGRLGSEIEDDGAILSVVYDSKGDSSFLLVLDARNMAELARAQLPEFMPYGFHGQVFRH